MDSTGDWVLESDEIGGIREYSTKQGSNKSLTIEAPKLWYTEHLIQDMAGCEYHLIQLIKSSTQKETEKMVNFYGNTFTRTYSSGAITMNQQSNTSPVSISNCVFDDCGGSILRCFNFATQTKSFTFRNN